MVKKAAALPAAANKKEVGEPIGDSEIGPVATEGADVKGALNDQCSTGSTAERRRRHFN
jgi:hypothetical protein